MTPTGGWCHAWSSSKNDKAVQGKRSAQNTSTNTNQEEREQDQPGRLVERPAGQSIQQAKYLTSSYLYPGGTRREGGVSFPGNTGPVFSDHPGHWVSGAENIRSQHRPRVSHPGVQVKSGLHFSTLIKGLGPCRGQGMLLLLFPCPW